MAFDVNGALKAGYSMTEIADHLAKGAKFNSMSARQAGYSDEEIVNHLLQGKGKQAPARQSVTPADVRAMDSSLMSTPDVTAPVTDSFISAKAPVAEVQPSKRRASSDINPELRSAPQQSIIARGLNAVRRALSPYDTTEAMDPADIAAAQIAMETGKGTDTVVEPSRRIEKAVKPIPGLAAAGLQQGEGGLVQAVGEMAPNTRAAYLGPVAGPLSMLVPWDKIAEAGKSYAESGVKEEKRLREKYPAEPGTLTSMVQSAGQSFGMQLVPMLSSIVTANPAPALAAMSGITAGQTYHDYRKRGHSPEASAIAATGQGIIEGGTELLPVTKLLNIAGGKQALIKSLIGLYGSEVPGEMIATVTQDMIDRSMIRPNMTVGEMGEEIKKYFASGEAALAQKETVGSTLIQTTATAGLGVGARTLTRAAANLNRIDPITGGLTITSPAASGMPLLTQEQAARRDKLSNIMQGETEEAAQARLQAIEARKQGAGQGITVTTASATPQTAAQQDPVTTVTQEAEPAASTIVDEALADPEASSKALTDLEARHAKLKSKIFDEEGNQREGVSRKVLDNYNALTRTIEAERAKLAPEATAGEEAGNGQEEVRREGRGQEVAEPYAIREGDVFDSPRGRVTVTDVSDKASITFRTEAGATFTRGRKALDGFTPVVQEEKEATSDAQQEETTGAEKDATSVSQKTSKQRGWNAAYLLAQIAQQNGTDLTKLSRTEYADFAVDHGAILEDDQLRMSPSLRSAASIQQIMDMRKVNRERLNQHNKESIEFYNEMRNMNTEDNGTGVRASNNNAKSNSWFHFHINGSTNANDAKTHKAYLGFDNVAKSLTAARFKEFMAELQKAGYNGQVKSIQDTIEQGNISDQIVMHGASEADVTLAHKVAKQFWGDEVNFTDTGHDVPGKSYSQWLAEDIANGVKQSDKSSRTSTAPATPTQTDTDTEGLPGRPEANGITIPDHVARAVEEPREVPTSVGVATKQQTKETLNAKLSNGEVTPDSPIRLTTVEELNDILNTGKLREGRDFEGRSGISAQVVDGKKPIVAYGPNDRISAAIVFPKEAARGKGESANEVKVDANTDPKSLRFVIDGHPELLTYEQLQEAIGGKVDSQQREAETEKAEVGKEPWEMTREEFRGNPDFWKHAAGAYINGDGVSDPHRTMAKNWLKTATIGSDGVMRGSVYEGRAPEPFPLAVDGKLHESIIKRALAEGKSVPPEVLAEYPDLAPKGKDVRAEEPPKPNADAARFAETRRKNLEKRLTIAKNGRERESIRAKLEKLKKVDRAAHEAATSPHNDLPEPTQAEKEAGNYKMGHTAEIHGLDISIENPAGSVRSGVSPDGKKWKTELKHHYGYIRGTVGKDKDHIDVFIGENPDSRKVFIVNQIDPETGRFDEHKVMLGFDSEAEARKGYLANYDSTGKDRIGSIVEMDIDDFKAWLKKGDTKKAAEQEKKSPEPQNAIFTEDAYQKARARMKAKLSQLNAGFDPELLQDGITIAGYHLERGARKFADYTKAMVDEFGDTIRPYLKAFYNGVRDLPGIEWTSEMDDYQTVQDASVEKSEARPLGEIKEEYAEVRTAWERDKSSPQHLSDRMTELRREAWDGYKIEEGELIEYAHEYGAKSDDIPTLKKRIADVEKKLEKLRYHATTRAQATTREARASWLAEELGSLTRQLRKAEEAQQKRDLTPAESAKIPVIDSGKGKPAQKSPEQELYDRATEAHAHVSMNPAAAAKVWRDGMVSAAEGLRESLEKIAKSDRQKEAVAAQVNLFKQGYVEHARPILSAISRQVSSMVVGKSQFGKNHDKRNSGAQSAEQKANDAFTKWQKEAKEYARQAILNARTPEEVKADEQAVADETKRVAAAKRNKELSIVKQWMALKPGDMVDVGGNGKVAIAKKNRKSIETEGGAKWTITELLGIESKKADELMAEAEAEIVGDTPFTLTSHDSLFKRLRDGEPVSVDEVKKGFDSMIESEEAIKAELQAMKKDDLLKRMGRFAAGRYKNEKKDVIVSAIYRGMVTDFAYLDGSNSLSYGMRDKVSDVVRKRVEKLTEEGLKKYAEAVAKERDDYKTRVEGYVKAIKNPETWEEFQKYRELGYKIEDLPPEKLKLYDELKAERNREQKAREAEKKATVSQVETDVEMTLKETTHTKKGTPLFVVQLSDRVERDVYNGLNAAAKKLGGYYSSFRGAGAVPGFQFKTREDAEKFMAIREGDVSRADKLEEKAEERQEKKVSKLRAVAESLKEKAEEQLSHDRLTNTARRARQANGAEESARSDIQLAETMLNLADAIESGEATHLDGVAAKTHVETLKGLLRSAKYAYEKAKDIPYIDSKNRTVTEDDVDFAKYPYPAQHESHIRDLATFLKDKKGAAMDAAWLGKMAKERAHDSIVSFIQPGDIERLESILAKTKRFVKDGSAKRAIENIADRIQDYNRLQRMGIPDLPSLRAALREFLKFRAGRREADKAKQLERDLVGKKVGVDFFPTPPELAGRMVEMAGVEPGMRVLEPSAGNGNIAEAIRDAGVEPDVAEISSSLREVLEAKGFSVVGQDFMDVDGEYDAIIMNPPFSDNQDIEHVRHAFDLLKPGGKLVAIMGEGAFFRGGKTENAFREWIDEQGADVEKLPEGTFTDRTLLNTTGANARLVVVKKEGATERVEVSDNKIITALQEIVSRIGTITKTIEAQQLDDDISKISDEIKRFNSTLAYRLMKKGEEGAYAATKLNTAEKITEYSHIVEKQRVADLRTAIDDAIKLLEKEDAENERIRKELEGPDYLPVKDMRIDELKRELSELTAEVLSEKDKLVRARQHGGTADSIKKQLDKWVARQNELNDEIDRREAEELKAPTWHTELPEQGFPVEDSDKNKYGTEYYSPLINKVLDDAINAITQVQWTNGEPLYARILPAKGEYNGRLRLVPRDQQTPGWEPLSGESFRIDAITRDQLREKLRDLLRRAPILGEKVEAKTEKPPAEPSKFTRTTPKLGSQERNELEREKRNLQTQISMVNKELDDLAKSRRRSKRRDKIDEILNKQAAQKERLAELTKRLKPLEETDSKARFEDIAESARDEVARQAAIILSRGENPTEYLTKSLSELVKPFVEATDLPEIEGWTAQVVKSKANYYQTPFALGSPAVDMKTEMGQTVATFAKDAVSTLGNLNGEAAQYRKRAEEIVKDSKTITPDTIRELTALYHEIEQEQAKDKAEQDAKIHEVYDREPVEYTIAAMKPLLSKEDIKTTEDVIKAFKDGLLSYETGRGSTTTYDELPDKEKADATLAGLLDKNAKVSVLKDRITLTVKGDPLTAEQKKENKEKAERLTEQAERYRKESDTLEENGYTDEQVKAYEIKDAAEGKKRLDNQVMNLRSTADRNMAEAEELLTAKNKDAKHTFWFNVNPLEQGAKAGGTALFWNYGNDVEQYRNARDAMKKLASLDKTFAENPVLTVVNKGTMENPDFKIEYHNGTFHLSLNPIAFALEHHNKTTPLSTVLSSGMEPYLKDGDTIRLSPGYIQNRSEEVFLVPAEAMTSEKGKVFFSYRITPATKGTEKTAIEKAIAPLLKKWKNAPEVKVVQSESELPENLKAEMASVGAQGEIDGVFNKGVVYLIADNMPNARDAVRVLLHEAVGHYGVRGLLGKRFDTVLLDVFYVYGKDGLREIADRYGLDLNKFEDRMIACEEKLAELAESGEKPGIIKRAIAAIRGWLRSIGVNISLSDNDVKAIISRAAGWVEREKGAKSYPHRGTGYISPEATGGESKDLSHRITDRGRMEEIAASFTRAVGASVAPADVALWLRNELDDLGRLGRVFQKQVVMFQSEREDISGLPGFFDPNRPDTIFINTDTPAPHLTVFGHELMHALKNQRPDLYKKFVEVARPSRTVLIDNKTFLEGRNGHGVTDEENVEEFLADYIGAKLTEKGFWEKLHAKSPQLFRAALDAVKRIIRKIQGIQFRTDHMFKDMKKAEEAALDVLNRYAKEGKAGESPRFSRRNRTGDPATDAVLDKIGRPDKTMTERLAGILDNGKLKLEQGIFDQFASLKALDKMAGVDSPDDSAYITARMTTGFADTFTAMLNHGAPVWANGWVKVASRNKGILKIFEPVANDLDLFLGWMVGERAQKLMNEGRENYFTQEEIDKLKALKTAENATRWERVRRDYVQYKKKVLDFAEQGGIINPDARRIWDHEEYVPFYRIAEDAEKPQGPTGKRGIASQNSGIRTLKGGTGQLGDIFENILRNFSHLTQAALKNRAAEIALEKAEEMGLASRAQWDWKAAHVETKQIVKKIREQLGAEDILEPEEDQLDDFMTLFHLMRPKGTSIVHVLKEGKPQYYEVHDELLLKSLTNLNAQVFQGAIMDLMRFTKRLLTIGVTSMPDFMIRNFVRDTLHTWVISRGDFTPGISSLKGAVKTFREDDDMVQLMAAGGSFHGGFAYGHDMQKTSRHVKKLLHKKGVAANILDTPAKLWDFWKKIGAAGENAARVSIYQNTLRKSGSSLQAAFEAKDVMDYSMRGDFAIVKFLCETVPFLGARMQGLQRLGKSMLEHPGSFAVKGGAIALAAVLLYLINRDDDRYKELEEWDKDTYFHFWIGKEHFRLPKPFEVGVLFGTIPERLTELLIEKQHDGKLFASRLLQSVTQTFAIGLPQLISELVQQWANRDSFTGRQIVGQRIEGLKPEDQKEPWTGATAVEVGNILGVSPKRIEHAVEGYFGTLGTYVLGASDIVMRRMLDYPAQPTTKLEEWPVVKSFYRGDEPPKNTKYLTEFYDLLKEVEQTYASIQEARKTGDRDRVRELRDENMELLRTRSMMEGSRDQLSAINRRMRRILYDKDMTGDEKREELDELTAKKNSVAKRAIERVESRGIQIPH